MMKLVSEYSLELTSLPFSKDDNQVIFIQSQFNVKLNTFIESHLIELTELFQREGLEFIFVPKTVNNEIHGNDIVPSCICNEVAHRTPEGIRFSAYHLNLSLIDKEDMMMLQFEQIASAYSRKQAIRYEERHEDNETVRLLYELERIIRALKVKGVSGYEFDDMLERLDKPGRMRIGFRGRITMPDYGNVEIRLNPMEKALYLYFLNHPEGVLPDAIVGDRRELIELYRRQTVFDDKVIMENIVDNLLAEDKKTLYTNISRIKKRFSDKLGGKIARHYTVNRDSEGRYCIDLPRDLVSREDRIQY